MQELSDFLNRIADVYSLPPLGREELGVALRQLAKEVRRTAAPSQPAPGARQARARTANFEELRSLDEAAIAAFIDDTGKTKDELVELAAARFSMPRSQLKRERADGIRQAIRSALMHESSIEIIGAEATRGGNARRS